MRKANHVSSQEKLAKRFQTTSIDATAIIAMSELDDELTRQVIALHFARVRQTVMDVIRRAGLDERLVPDRFYVTIQAGVGDYLSETSQW